MASATIKEALLEVSSLWLHEAAVGRMNVETADLYMQVSERLHRYAAAHGIHRMDDVSKDLADAFSAAPGRGRRNNITLNPAGSTRRQRRSAIASFFAHARALGMTKAAPLLDSRRSSAVPAAPAPTSRHGTSKPCSSTPSTACPPPGTPHSSLCCSPDSTAQK